MTSPMQNEPVRFNAINLIKMLVKWRKQITTLFIITLLVSYAATWLITPMFKSTTVVYPFNLGNYSKESATEQMVQLFKSEDVKENLIKAFALYKHYDIDTSGSSPRHEIMLMLDENISVNKTEYESVEINILDKDPKIAAQMCDSIIVFMDKKALTLIREKARENMLVSENRLAEKKVEMDSMLIQQKELSEKYGILDYENQVIGFSREYYRSMGGGGSSSKMEQAKRNLEEKGNEAFSLKENLWRVRGQYNDIKKQREDFESDYTKEISFHNLVTKAVPAEKKDSPKRMVLSLLITLSVMSVALLVIIYQEYYKKQFDESISG
ncbi:MAG: hypothetical protein ABI772_06595 [Bacteroidota bacterium]